MDRLIHKLIFLAEDDQDDGDFFKSALHAIDPGHQLTLFHDGVALMQQLQETTTLPDLLVLDLNMPRKDGRQCIRQIRENHLLRHIPIIVFSTSSWSKDVSELYECGADLFVVKPNSYRNLVHLITEILSIDWATHLKSERFLVKESTILAPATGH